MDVDFAREKFEVFEQGWEYMRDNFYDPAYHGVNWQAARAEYRPFIAGAQTPDEMRRLMRLMVGELNASHLGVSGPFGGGAAFTTGRLGLGFDREEYERAGRLRVTEVVPLGPAALARDSAAPERARAVNVGEYVLAVDGRAVDARTNLDELLELQDRPPRRAHGRGARGRRREEGVGGAARQRRHGEGAALPEVG